MLSTPEEHRREKKITAQLKRDTRESERAEDNEIHL